MKHRVVKWRDWEDLAWIYEFDAYSNIEFSVDTGGGNTDDYYYIGDVPEKEQD